MVINPSTIPKLSFKTCNQGIEWVSSKLGFQVWEKKETLAIGARQLVVQEAFETTSMSGVYLSLLTPMTKVGISSLGGAEMITLRAPPFKCWRAPAPFVKTPVDSQM